MYALSVPIFLFTLIRCQNNSRCLSICKQGGWSFVLLLFIFLQLAIALYDSVGLCQQCYVFVLPGNIKFCEKVVTRHIIATFWKSVASSMSRHMSASLQKYLCFQFSLNTESYWTGTVNRLRIHCHPELESKLVRFMPHILNKLHLALH